MSTTRPGQIPCPDCGQPLPLPIESVLVGRPIICAGCGMELQVKSQDSKEALSALGRWYQETAPAREVAAESGAPKASPLGEIGRWRARSRR